MLGLVGKFLHLELNKLSGIIDSHRHTEEIFHCDILLYKVSMGIFITLFLVFFRGPRRSLLPRLSSGSQKGEKIENLKTNLKQKLIKLKTSKYGKSCVLGP